MVAVVDLAPALEPGRDVLGNPAPHLPLLRVRNPWREQDGDSSDHAVRGLAVRAMQLALDQLLPFDARHVRPNSTLSQIQRPTAGGAAQMAHGGEPHQAANGNTRRPRREASAQRQRTARTGLASPPLSRSGRAHRL